MYVRSPVERAWATLVDPRNRNLVVGLGLLTLTLTLGLGRCTSWPEDPGPIDPPRQSETERAAFGVGSWRITPRAEYEVTGVVVSTHRYWFDATASLSRWDVGLAWGRSARADVLGELRFTHHTRFLHWRSSHDLAVSFDVLETEIANVHTIASTPAIRREIGRLRPGQLARLRGALVDADSDEGHTWRTSLTRTDRGNGACEILWVESVEVLPLP